jgi:hypothetical protein
MVETVTQLHGIRCRLPHGTHHVRKDFAMSRLKLFLSLFVLLALGLAAAPVAAQDEGTPSALDDPSLLEGIELAVSRDWSVDFDTMMMASPDAEMDMSGLFLVSAQAIQFDNDENASAAYQLYIEEGVPSLTSDPELAGEDAEITESEVDLGDEAYQVDLVSTTEGEEGAFRVAFAREGNYVYLVFAIAMEPDSANLATDVLDYMVNEGEPGEGEGTFNEDGGSEGGIWDVFPPNDHPALESMVPSGDSIDYPATEE